MTSSNELVSVLLSTYNSEETLGKSINSLLNQTYKNLEILISDDGSTDSTKEICKKFQLKDERILLFSNKNICLKIFILIFSSYTNSTIIFAF